MTIKNNLLIPKKWHIYVVNLEPRVGSKPGKQRPCLCIQPSEFCEFGLNFTAMLPLTTKIIKEDVFPLRVKIKKGICGLEKESDILIDQILAWDISFLKEDLGIIPEGLQELVKIALKDFLDL
jgi:mRNA interferase MazF